MKRTHLIQLIKDGWGAGCNLHKADLYLADLREANLSGTNLSEADLSESDLREADLRSANLSAANLIAADLREADLRAADLRGANLRGANLSDANLLDAVLPAGTPVIEDLDGKILRILEAGEGTLDMSDWHTCPTTHCRAGWAIMQAGEAAGILEKQLGSEAAGALIYAASYPELPIPNFYASDNEALDDIRRRAGVVK